MRPRTNKFAIAGIVAAIATLTMSAGPAAAQVTMPCGTVTKKAQTAQSVMIDIAPLDFVVTDTETWQFDSKCGETHFTGGTSAQNASTAELQKCTFFDGGTLVSRTIGRTTVSPTGANPVDPKTCWNLQSSSGGGTAHVCVNAVLAGESYVLSNQFSPNGKYSFTLQNSDGSSRIGPLTVTLSGDASQTDIVGSTVVPGAAGDPPDGNNCLLGQSYTGNAGSNGSIKSCLADGTMGDILKSDSFSSNDAGCSYTAIANMDQVCYDLTPGSYSVNLAGTVKGVDGTKDLSFSGSSNISISAQGCE